MKPETKKLHSTNFPPCSADLRTSEGGWGMSPPCSAGLRASEGGRGMSPKYAGQDMYPDLEQRDYSAGKDIHPDLLCDILPPCSVDLCIGEGGRGMSSPLVRIFILTCILLFSFMHSFASFEPTKTNKKNLAVFAIGDSLITSVTLVDNDTHQIHRTWNRITLSVCTDTNLCYTDSFAFTAIFEARYWDVATNTYHFIDTIELAVSYNPATGRLYTEKNTYAFEGAYKVTLIPLSYSSSTLKARVCVFNEIDAEHWWNMAYFLSDSVTFTGAPALQSSSGEYLLTWQMQDWAEEYDLEWTWVDDYEDLGSYLPEADVNFNFRFNSGRVTVKGNTYRINPLFEHGYVIFRIRGVGYGGDDHRHRITSAWSIPYVEKDMQYVRTYYNKYTLKIDENLSHQDSLNWQYMATYAEEGKKKEVVSYFDGSLRNRQSVTKINSDTTAIVGESFYDYQGRPALSSLPVPSFSPKLSYYSNFTVNEFNLPYSKENFDKDSTGEECLTRTGAMDTTKGASKYYSANNPYKNIGHHAYIPDAMMYPFTQVEYTPDNTGRIARQGGVGKDHQLGSGHETKYFYGTPDSAELVQLFGTNVGVFEHYRKNMVQDANGQMSISYLDAKGKVIATALAGNNPSNVQSLSSNSQSSVHTTLIAQKDTIYEESELVMNRQILVSADNTQYKIKYSLQGEKFTPACIEDICYDCVYDLEISLLDNCGREQMPGGEPIVRTIGRVLGEGIYDTLCYADTVKYSFKNDGALSGYLGGTNNEYVLVNLDAGEYHLVKTLKINQSALDYYTNKYIEQGLESGCLISQDSFVRKAYQTIDTTTCDMDCAQCRTMIGADTTFIRQYMTALIEDGVTPIAYDTTKADSLYELRLRSCDVYCDTVDPCRAHYYIMLSHVSPGGHFALVSTFSQDSNYVFAAKNMYSIFGIKNAPADTNGFLMQNVAASGIKYDTVMVNGVKRAITDLSATELFFNWQPEWAHILVKIHPEYCQYQWCLQNKASYRYDQDMLKTEGYQAALDSGYLNPLGSTGDIDGNALLPYSMFTINHKDPYFEISGNSTQKAALKTLLEDYVTDGGSTLSAWELMIASNCAGETTFADYYNCIQDFFDNGQIECDDTTRLNKYWNVFRGMYLNKKRFILDEYRTKQTACSTGYALVHWQNWIMYTAVGETVDFAFTTQEDAINQMGYTGGNQNDLAYNKSKAKAALRAACDSQCTGYASRWMQQLGDCAFAHDSDKVNFRRSLIAICMGGCDQNNPLGASSVAPRYKSFLHNRLINGNPYDIYSFKDVFDAYVAEGLIITTGGVDSVRKCNIDAIDMPGNYRHDYFLSSANVLNISAADTFLTRDSIPRYEIDGCACKALNDAAAVWSDSVSGGGCYDSLHLYVNYLYQTELSAIEVAVLRDACNFRPASLGGAGAVDDCEQVIVPERIRASGGDTTKSFVPIVKKMYWPALGDTAIVTIYPNDTLIVPAVPPELSCAFSPPKPETGCLTCSRVLLEAIWFVEKYEGAPDTAYILPQLYANILNRNYGFNLPYYEFTRFLNSCDTIFDLLFGMNYKAIGTGEEDMPKFAEGLDQEVSLNYPSGINEESKLGSCACEKAMRVYLTWVDLKNTGKLSLEYATFPPFAALNGIHITEPFTMDQLLDNCKSWLDIDSVLSDSFYNCGPDTVGMNILCYDELDQPISCSDPNVVRRDTTYITETVCDTFKVINYCYLLNKFKPGKVCARTLDCEVLTAKLEESPQTSIQDAEEYLNAEFDASLTVLGTEYPLDPDTCTSGCTRDVFMVCSDLTEDASDYFEMLNSLALTDTLDADSIDMNGVFSFRRSAFNRGRYTQQYCSAGNSKKDPNAYFKGLDYAAGAIEGDDPFDYVFTISYDLGTSNCRVYLDSLNVPALDSIFRFIEVRPTSAFKNGRQDFTFTVKLHDSSEVTGRGHTGCFTISACCAPSIRLCNKPLITRLALESPCKASLKNAALANGKAMYEAYLDSVRTAFRQAWTVKCLQGGRNEVMEMEYNKREYHYTLYYYDQAGNLAQTIPPAGVQILNPTQIATAIGYLKTDPDMVYEPAHTLRTVYHYNSLNQLIWQRTPDADTSEFFYDRLGRLTFSQNKKQKNGSDAEEIKYSYTVYDALGRIKEVGELRSPYTVTHAASRRQTFVEDSALAGTRSEITKTWYDAVKYSISNGSFAQRQLRGRVAHITYQDAQGSSYRHAVHYSYDSHGNVYSMVRENVQLAGIGQQYKQTDYDYDLVSGKVNQVNYQQGEADQFYHRYEYDADNRLTNAYTSTDSVHWDRDARYFYYLHGPLARTETGQHKVQGTDYAYTLHGWLKGVNSNTLDETRDMGKDGWVSGANTNRNVARDVFGFTLSYYNTSTAKDYTAINAATITSSNMFEAELYNKDFGNASSSLFNGNIKSMVTAISKFMEGGATPMGYAYQYDQLNRLLKAEAYNNINCSTNTWNTGGSAMPDYHNRFTYDANGNILTQVRRGSAASGFALDSLTYHYASNKNQLTYVDDAVSGSAYTDDIDDQSSGNYEYDEIGNLIGDAQEQIDSIEWTVYGKIKRITRTNGSLKPDLEFEYSPDGHRVCKIVKPKVGNHIWNYTYYVRDAQGNIMATYDRTLEAIFDPEQTDYEDVNAELVSLNGVYAFQGFIEDLHPLASSADFVDSLLLGLLASDTYHKSLFINSILPFYREEIMADNLTNNATAYSYVLSQLGDQEFTETMQAEHGTSTILKKICDYDASFINTCVSYSYSSWLTNFATNDWTNFDQMHYDIRGFHESTLATAVVNLLAYQTDVVTWIGSNGGCLQNATITAYFSSGDISSLLSGYGYSNARTALMSQLSTADVIQALTGQTLTFNIWSYLSNDYPDDIINYFFTAYTSQAYAYLLLSNPQLVGPVQTANYYYSKTSYFNSIKTIYGQYTYDVLVGKFITLSNQFKDRFVLSEWHLYGSARLGIQKPKLVTLSDSEGPQPYGTSGGRELVHIAFEGSWSEYEVDYNDTSNTTVSTYQMSYDYYSLIRGEKNYELTNYLENVMVVVSDKKLKTCEGDTVNYYMADVIQATDYNAFGVALKDREYFSNSSNKYRNGFNGKEHDDEINGEGNAYDFGARIYDARLGRWMSVDPETRNYVSLSCYNYCGLNPIVFKELDGAIFMWATTEARALYEQYYNEASPETKAKLDALAASDIIYSIVILPQNSMQVPGAEGCTYFNNTATKITMDPVTGAFGGAPVVTIEISEGAKSKLTVLADELETASQIENNQIGFLVERAPSLLEKDLIKSTGYDMEDEVASKIAALDAFNNCQGNCGELSNTLKAFQVALTRPLEKGETRSMVIEKYFQTDPSAQRYLIAFGEDLARMGVYSSGDQGLSDSEWEQWLGANRVDAFFGKKNGVTKLIKDPNLIIK